MECFVCHEVVHGDDAFVSFHLNECLDRQDSGTRASPRTNASSSGPKHGKQSARNSSVDLSSEYSVAQALHASLDEQTALALNASLNGHDQEVDFQQRHRRDAQDDGVSRCPLCDNSWLEMGVGDTEPERAEHATECMEGMKALREEFFGGGPSQKSAFTWEKMKKGKKELQSTKGLVQVLSKLLERSHREGRTQSAYLASERTEHLPTQLTDFSWGCCYRNIQMIFSAARHLEAYSRIHGDSSTTPPIPSIADFQAIIEEAWKYGHDPPSAAYFGHKLVGKRRWIGTTEAYTALTWLGIRARIIDFPAVPGNKDGAHVSLVRWILNYFASETPPILGSKRTLQEQDPASKDDASRPSTLTNAFGLLMQSRGRAVKLTEKQPLYLQHQGHSRTVVGVDVGKSGNWLIMLDPGKRISMTLAKAGTRADAADRARGSSSKDDKPDNSDGNHANKRYKSSSPSSASSSSRSTSPPPASKPRGGFGRKTTSTSQPASSSTSSSSPAHAAFFAETPGFERIWNGKSSATGPTGVSATSDGQQAVLSASELSRYVKLLEPYRVSMASLSRKDEYQVLFVEEGPSLNAHEKAARKTIRSTFG